jgi:hypothetical protein
MRKALELEITARDRGIESGENNFGRTVGLGRRHRHFGNRIGNGSLQPPARRFRVRASFGTIGGRQPRHFKPRVIFEHLDKSLPDDARGTENSYR